MAARQQQQRLLAQQSSTITSTPQTPLAQLKQLPQAQSQKLIETPKISRLNGARQLFADSEPTEPYISSSTTPKLSGTDKREPPQPPPPPLVPILTNSRSSGSRLENDDSNSNSVASSSGIHIGMSSVEDGDNSLTSFEGLLNGVPNVDSSLMLNDDSNSKDSLKGLILKNKPLMLADLLEKKVDKDLPTLNGMMGKELRIGDKGERIRLLLIVLIKQ